MHKDSEQKIFIRIAEKEIAAPLAILNIIYSYYELIKWANLSNQEKAERITVKDFSYLDLRITPKLHSIIHQINWSLECDKYLQDADFRFSNLSNLYLGNRDLSKAKFSNANLTKVNLFRAKLSKANFKNSTIQGTKLELIQLERVKGIDLIKDYYLSSYCGREEKQGLFRTPTHKKLAMECQNEALPTPLANKYIKKITFLISKSDSNSEFFHCLKAIIPRELFEKIQKNIFFAFKPSTQLCLIECLAKSLPGLKRCSLYSSAERSTLTQ